MKGKIQTLHPEGKQGVNIDRARYDAIRDAILDVLTANGPVTFGRLVTDVEAELGDTFDGSIPWYVTTVKLDLEARRTIERVPKSQPQQLRIVEGAELAAV